MTNVLLAVCLVASGLLLGALGTYLFLRPWIRTRTVPPLEPQERPLVAIDPMDMWEGEFRRAPESAA